MQPDKMKRYWLRLGTRGSAGLQWLDQVVDLLLGFGGSLQGVLILERRRPSKSTPYLQEDIQLLSNVVNSGDLGLGFLDEIIFLLLELLSPFVESMYIPVRNI